MVLPCPPPDSRMLFRGTLWQLSRSSPAFPLGLCAHRQKNTATHLTHLFNPGDIRPVPSPHPGSGQPCDAQTRLCAHPQQESLRERRKREQGASQPDTLHMASCKRATLAYSRPSGPREGEEEEEGEVRGHRCVASRVTRPPSFVPSLQCRLRLIAMTTDFEAGVAARLPLMTKGSARVAA